MSQSSDPRESTRKIGSDPSSDLVRVQISVNSEKTLATLTAFPKLGQTLTPKELSFALREAGVTLPPDPKAVSDLSRALERNVPVRNLAIARAIPATPGKSAQLERYGDWKKPVFPGDVFGKLFPAVKPRLGRLLDGTPMDPPETGKYEEIFVLETGHVSHDADGYLKAERYGLAQLHDNYISVEPLLRVSPDFMEVRTTVYETTALGDAVDLVMMQDALSTEEIVEYFDGNACAKALAEAHETGEPKPHVVICRGIQPQPGKDGWFDMHVHDGRSEVGLETSDGRIDFRARGVVRSIQAGEHIGSIIPPEEGRPGRDVYGRIIPAPHGRPFPLHPQENVTTSDKVEYYATSGGMVFFIRNTISVTEIFSTPGDVDMSTGNIEIEKGSVHIGGAVLSGFSVKSPRNLVVEDVIEGAKIEAGGDVEVRGGILMDRIGSISCEGGVSALYAKNAIIQARGDVNIAHEITNCDIRAGQRVIASRGRGKIIGGIVRGEAGVAANEVGSELGVETIIQLGTERRTNEPTLQRVRQLKLLLHKIYGSLGSDSPKAILERTRPEKREQVAQIIKSRLAMESELRELEEFLDREREELRLASQASLKVRGIIHPGVVVRCFGFSVKLKKAVEHSRIYYDPAQRRVVVGNL